MAGPQDWGAVAVAEPEQKDAGPAAWGAQSAQEGQATGTVPVISDAEQAQAAMRQNFQQGNYLRSLGDLFYGMGATAVQSLIEGHARTSELMTKEANGNLTDEERLELGLNFGMGLGGGAEMPRAVAGPIREFQDTVINPGLQKIAAEARPPADTPEGVMAQPEVRDAILNGPVNRDNHVPYEAGAAKGTDPTTNIDKSIPEIAKLPSGAQFDTATPLKIHEQVEKFVMDKLTAGGMSDEAAYRVGHWEYAERAEDAWYASQGIDPREAEAWWTERSSHIEHEPTSDTPPDLYDKPYPHDSVSLANEGPPGTPKPSPEEIAQAQQILGKSSEEMGGHLADFFKARELGVFDEPKPEQRATQTPAEMAFEAYPVNATITPEGMKGRFGHAPGSYDVKGAEWAAKIDAPENARAAVAEIGKKYDWFPESRAGVPSLKARAAIADAAGLDPAEIDGKWLSSEFDNDGKVRAVIQGLKQTERNFTDASDAMRAQPSEENAAAQLEAEEHHRNVLEYVMGKRAESGRSLAVWKEALRETERSRASVKLRRDEEVGNVPVGLTDLVNAAGDIQRNLKNPQGGLGLDKLIKAAENVVDVQDKTPATRQRLDGVAKRARAAAKEVEAGKKPSGFDALINEAQELAKTLPRGPKEAGKPEPQGIASMINEAKRALNGPHGAAGLIKLAEEAERLAMTMPRSAEEAAAKLPPDLAGLISQARSIVTNMKKPGNTPLEKLIGQVDKQTRDVLKQNPPRKPIEALPPELQGLVDKAERVVDRFGGMATGEKAAFLLARAGRTAAEQAEIARSVDGMSPTQVARVLDKLHKTKGTPWYYAIPQQLFLTGPVTHTLYFGVNAANLAYRRIAQPLVASLFDKVLPGKSEMSTLAALRALPELLGAVPDAGRRALQALKTGERVLSVNEERLVARGELTPGERGAAKTPYTRNKIDFGIWRRIASADSLATAEKVMTAPGAAANAIHTFFRMLGERAAAGQIAYTKAANEIKFSEIGSDRFWARYDHHLANPTDAELGTAAEKGYVGTYMEEMGPAMQKLSQVVKETPLKWIVFFMHIPFNIVKQGAELMPTGVLAPFTNTRMGRALRGELGREEQHLALSAVTIGAAVSGYFIHKGMTGSVTGGYPTDPKERQRWKDLNIQPYSIQLGDEWVSMERFGSLAMPMKAAADYGYIFNHYDFTDPDEASKGGAALALATGNVMLTDSGFSGLLNIAQAVENREERGNALAWQLAGYAQPASMLSQAASFHDPYMRETGNFINAFKNRVPLVREGLLPKRDPVYGEQVPNPGYHGIVRTSPVNHDPVMAELGRIGYYPAAPRKQIGTVKLDGKLYNEYEATAGQQVKRMLGDLIRSPIYRNAPQAEQVKMMRGTIKIGRALGAQAMFAHHPELARQGWQAREQAIRGD